MRILNALLICSIAALASCSNGADKSKRVDESKTANKETKAVEVKMILPDGPHSLISDMSTIIWSAKKFTGTEHTGTIPVKNAKIEVDAGEIVKGEIILDMNGFTVTDLEGEDKAGFDGHLKSSDFLDVEKYPTADMSIIAAQSENGSLIAKVKLQLHGIKVIYKVPVFISKDSKKGFRIRGNFSIDRTKHKINYNSGSIFDNLGDQAIDDKVQISFDLLFS